MTVPIPARARLAAAALLVSLTLLTALMPPGLCACWLNPSVETVHIHFGQADDGHSHEYLSDSADTAVTFALTLLQPALLALLMTALAGAIWTIVSEPSRDGRSWSPSPRLPPPKTSTSLP